MIRIAQSCVTATFVPLYSLLVFRDGPDAPDRWVAYLGGGGYGRGPYASQLLDLHTAEEFKTTDTDAEHRAPQGTPDRSPGGAANPLATPPQSGLLLQAGYDTNKGTAQVDVGRLRQIAATPKVQAPLTLFA